MFRKEVIQHRSNRLSGDVMIAVPLGWQAIGYLLFGGLAATLLFLSVADYARVEAASGQVIPDTGVATILPSRRGIVTALPVKEGDEVSPDTLLAEISAEEAATGASSSADRIEAAIASQDASLIAQSRAAEQSAAAELTQLAAQQSTAVAEVDRLNAQIAYQRQLVAMAEKDLQLARPIATRGFVSARDIATRETTLLSRRQTMAQLEQALAARQGDIEQASRTAGRISAQSRVEVANLSASRAQVAQQAASASGARGYVLRAPVAGRVTAISARVGQPASTETPLMTIVPSNADLRVELMVPSAAIGFVRPGQSVNLAVDSFPYQRFGTLTGTVVTIAATSVGSETNAGETVPVYPVTIELDRDFMLAFGRQERLLPGMRVTARIITERQSLLRWLFEPLFAIAKR